MNEILTKATEELAKDAPNIAYVRGMLDTLLAMNGDQTKPIAPPVSKPTDEGSILDAQLKAQADFLATIQNETVDS